MALSNNRQITAWGDVHVYLGATGASDAMATSFDDLGAVSPDNFSITTNDGTKYELKDINGKRIDTLKQEPTLTITFGLLGPSETTRGKFWTISESGTGENRKLKVTSLIQNSKMSFKLANPAAAGSETFEAAKTTVSMNLDYAADRGFSGTVSVELLWPDRTPSELFQFGVVPSLPGGNVEKN